MLKFDSKARNLGKSTGVIIPKVLCTNYGIEIHDELILIPTEKGILITTKKLQDGDDE